MAAGRRCGTCRTFWDCGERDETGLRLGYCDEFPMAGKIDENCACEGQRTPYRPKYDKEAEDDARDKA